MIKVLFLILALLFVTDIGLDWVVLRHLKEKHTKVWVRIGSPTIFLNHSIGGDMKVMRFKWRNEHRQLDDKLLNTLILIDKGLAVVYWSLAAVLIFALIRFFREGS